MASTLIKALLALGAAGGICLPLAFEFGQIGDEQRQFTAGHYAEAARALSRVHVLYRFVRQRVERQLASLPDGGAGALPLLESAAARDPALRDVLRNLLRAVDPGKLDVDSLALTYGVPPSEASAVRNPMLERFRALPTPDEPNAWGRPFKLARRDASGAWLEVGNGFAGPLGSSFALAPDGGTLWLAREADKALERWELAAGTKTRVPVKGTPAWVTLSPSDPERVAYTLSDDKGDTLWLDDHNRQQQIFPAPGAPPAPMLGVAWASDGASLLVYWQEEDPSGKPNTQLVWIRPDGHVGLEASLDMPIADFEPVWIRAPGASRIGLTVDGVAWLWSADAAQARALVGVSGIWGFDPSGRTIAGVDRGSVYVLALDAPQRRFEQRLPQLPPAFEGDPASFQWRRHGDQDMLTFAGAVPGVAGQGDRPVTITIQLAEQRRLNR